MNVPVGGIGMADMRDELLRGVFVIIAGIEANTAYTMTDEKIVDRAVYLAMLARTKVDEQIAVPA